MEFSKSRRARIREEGVDAKQLAVAELMAWGWKAEDAMLAVGLISESDDKYEARRTAINYSTTPEITAAYKKRVKQLRNGSVIDEHQKIHPTPGTASSNRGRTRADGTKPERKLWQEDPGAPIADSEILAAMWDTITKLDPGDPKRVDLLDKYDKLKRRQGAGEDDTTIHFYLPRPECDACPFRGDHIISDPERKPETGKPEEEDPDAPKPGYSAHGRKLGRPPKRRSEDGDPEEEDRLKTNRP